MARALTSARIAFERITIDGRKKPVFDTNLIHVNPEALLRLSDSRPDWLEWRKNVAYWNWELPQMPLQWAPALEWVDALVVPSTFTASSLRKNTPVPVHVIPYCVDTLAGAHKETGRDRAKPFVFYYCFDGRSYPPRKNPLAVAQAFERVHHQFPNTRLVVKCVHFDEIEPNLRRRLQRIKKQTAITWIDGFLSTSRMRSLMACCDAYVSLHGAEGWGIPIFDALAHKKAVIQTAYSGPMDYLNDANSLLVKFELSVIKRSCGPYGVGQTLAQVDLTDAASKMMRLMETPGLAQELGAAGFKTVSQYLTSEKVGEKFRALAGQLHRSPKVSPRPVYTQRKLRAVFLRWRQVWNAPNHSGRVRFLRLRRLAYRWVWATSALSRCADLQRPLALLYQRLMPPSSL